MSIPIPSSQKITLTCGCGRQVQAQLADFRNRRTVRCSAGHTITLKEDRPGEIAKADRAAQQLDHELKKLDQTLRRLGG